VRVAAPAAAGAGALLRELETVPPHVVGGVGAGAPFASLHAGARLCFAPAAAHVRADAEGRAPAAGEADARARDGGPAAAVPAGAAPETGGAAGRGC
jgi:hypothetical protein